MVQPNVSNPYGFDFPVAIFDTPANLGGGNLIGAPQLMSKKCPLWSNIAQRAAAKKLAHEA
jgi:hypothetical protein